MHPTLIKHIPNQKDLKQSLKDRPLQKIQLTAGIQLSGATRTSDAIKKAALEAIQSAPVAGETVTIDTAKLEVSNRSG